MSTDIAGDDTQTEHVVSRVSFDHVTLNAGNESMLLRFEYDTRDEVACVLIDAGNHLDLDSCLRSTDTLEAVCLTHAHADHYQSLDSALGGDTRLFTSPATAAILGTVLASAEDSGFVSDPDRILEATTPINGWTDVAPNVRVHPVPAGHTPGAVGFVVRFRDEHGNQDMLFTGDFTLTSAGGYAGFDSDAVSDVESLFLTVATTDDAEDQLTEGITEAIERAHGGATVLVTAAGLQGVHLATLLATVSAELDLDIPVQLVGQAAKIYDDLEYNLDGVHSIHEFANPASCLDHGVVTIAGPDVPTKGSAKRLYGVICDDPNACLVQFVSSNTTPLSGTGPCATFDYCGSMHPSRETLNTIVDAVNPVEVITVHEHGGAGRRYNDLNSCVWSATERSEFTLYENGRWLAPPWTNTKYAWVPDQPVDIGHLVGYQLDDFPLTSIDRSEVDLAQEGVDVDCIRERLHRAQPTDHPTEHCTTPMVDSSDANEKTDSSDAQLYRTTNAEVDATGSLSDNSLAPDGIVSGRAWQNLGADATAADQADTRDANENEQRADAVPQTDEVERGEIDADADQAHADAESDVLAEQTVEDEAESQVLETETDQDEADDESPATPGDSTVAFEIDPLLLAIVRRRVEEQSVETFVIDALHSYLETILRTGEVPEGTTDNLDIDISVGERLGPVLTGAVHDEGYGSVSDAARIALAELLGSDTTTISISEQKLDLRFVTAAIANPDYGFESRHDFADAAVLWSLDDQ
ncbi:MBL fold metallo-hydrolase [Halogeometricum sp. S1BR25-6]|uniref:MBL fold metallo-hydrolase n=1 Tax=Halogeometricum salsisoli TaxID=2950536 RepID=A0ABU2GKL0_9EURY|nr:MBL fold metallo-hydrolase [Halogeometricum sp. S1BR25-6]MDS0300921.1 MBL fold metallo-hydrolase [Halogeometricum sp. S1BR25-6]